MSLDANAYEQLKTALWPIKGDIKWSKLHEGLAHGFGFTDSYSLKSGLAEQNLKLSFDVNAFLERMGQLECRPGPDVNDPLASLRALAVTTLSIAEPTRFLEIMNETGVTSPVIRLDVTDKSWKQQVLHYRAALTRHWGVGTSGYVETASEKPWVCWTITPPLRWKRGDRFEVTNAMIKVQQGRDFGHVLDQRDVDKIQAIETETGENPASFFSRILTDLRPYLPGVNDNDIDPIDDILFTDEGLMVKRSFNNRRTSDGLGCAVFFEKIPFQRQKIAV